MIRMQSTINPEPGTYVLLLQCHQRANILIGRWGQLEVQPGYYLYVGSAFGPGGVKARVMRHCRKSKAKHWHFDYLREAGSPLAVLCSYQPVHLEHLWAEALLEAETLTPIKKFGCSDCDCKTHLFYTARRLRITDFVTVLPDETVIDSYDLTS